MAAPVIAPAATTKVGHYRWYICALLFFATTINYVDRQVIGILKGTLQGEFGWTEIDYSNIVFSFQFAYAIGLMLAGRLMDRLGTRTGYALAIVVWSVAAIAHAEATVFGPLVQRVVLACDRTWRRRPPSPASSPRASRSASARPATFRRRSRASAEWFPKKERALATGIFNSGTNVGALLTPLVVPWITRHVGLVLGVCHHRPARVSSGSCVVDDLRQRRRRTRACRLVSSLTSAATRPKSTTPIPWPAVIKHREAWAFAIGKFMTDPIWWLYLFWLADFLRKNHGLSI